MANWTRDEHLTFDIAFALKKVTLPGFRKALKEEDRIAIAATILEHLKLCRWKGDPCFVKGGFKGEPTSPD